jgi:2'-5' RNA ligase
MPYGIILIPPPDFCSRLARYAAQVGPASIAAMRVGNGAPPHVTVAHGDCTPDAAKTWWRDVSAADPDGVTVRLVGLMLAPIPVGNHYVPEGGVYAGIEAFRDAGLEEVHRAALASAAARGVATIGPVGDQYRPHLTLAVFDAVPVIPHLPADLVTATVDTRLALGRLGPYGTFPDILAVAPSGATLDQRPSTG